MFAFVFLESALVTILFSSWLLIVANLALLTAVATVWFDVLGMTPEFVRKQIKMIHIQVELIYI